MKRLFARTLLALMLLGAAGAALAHRFHTGITEISFNDKTGSVEVVHTLMAHDIDAVLAARHKRQLDLADADDEALLRKYVDEHFQLLGKNKAALQLNWVGSTANVESVVIYQELPGTTLEQVRRVRNSLLTDYLPRQVNTLNVKRKGEIKSYTFDRKQNERALPVQ
jgi:hypothetical protein